MTERSQGTSRKPIRVLHVLSSLNRGGGMIRVPYNYQLHIDPSQVSFDYLYFFEMPDNLMAEVKEMGSRTWHVPAGKSLLGFFREHRGEFDIVHCHPIFASQLVGWPARLHGAKAVIQHSHSTRYSDKASSARRNAFLARFMGLFATDYVACSDGARALLRGHGKDAYIMRNAIDPDEFAFSADGRARVRAELGASDGTLVLGTLGRCSQEKNQTFLLDVAEELAKRGIDFKVAVAGDGPLRCDLENQIAQRDLAGKVVALGSRSDARDLYSAFDCFALPSLFEGLPVSAVEAQATGLPCFLSDTITRDVAFGKVEFLPLGDAEAWANAVLAGSGERKPAEQGLLARSGFDINVEAKRLVEYYRQIASR